ncbi:TetR/AcrR family transcriptional regulator [Kribbella sp. NPDC058245]|uniref:TetR/AcrR family transcriptional regulator n=1 Tax=Kribbella sp. NPDC058245 TaxID=3346399 RepID=UPI0036EAC60E
MSQTTPRPGSPRWWQNRPPREPSAEPGPGRPAMSFDRVIRTALELIDEVGPDDFSMRLLAKRLGSSTATLYRHFKGKDEILVHVVDHLFGEIPRYLTGVSPDSTWQAKLTGSAEAMFRTLTQHPRVASLLDDQVPLGPHALAGREIALGVLLASGFPPEAAARAFTAVGHYIIGFAGQPGGHEASRQYGKQEIREFYRSLDAARFPATLAAGPYLPNSLDDEFRFGLQLIVTGLEKHLTEHH